jgi:hypothetical protein
MGTRVHWASIESIGTTILSSNDDYLKEFGADEEDRSPDKLYLVIEDVGNMEARSARRARRSPPERACGLPTKTRGTAGNARPNWQSSPRRSLERR